MWPSIISYGSVILLQSYTQSNKASLFLLKRNVRTVNEDEGIIYTKPSHEALLMPFFEVFSGTSKLYLV